MTEQYNSQGRYNIYYEGDQKRGEVVKGVLYEGEPDFRQETGRFTAEDLEGLNFVHQGARFKLVRQEYGLAPAKPDTNTPLN